MPVDDVLPFVFGKVARYRQMLVNLFVFVKGYWEPIELGHVNQIQLGYQLHLFPGMTEVSKGRRDMHVGLHL